jgi:hypothetical protein
MPTDDEERERERIRAENRKKLLEEMRGPHSSGQHPAVQKMTQTYEDGQRLGETIRSRGDMRRRSPTPPHNTATFKTFETTARDFALRLSHAIAMGTVKADPATSKDIAEPFASMPSHEVREELLKYARIFEGWLTQPETRPPPEMRSPYVSRYQDLYRRTLDLLSGK